MANSIDWLSDYTGLIGSRTKAVTSRPIKDLAGDQSNIKMAEFPVTDLVIGLWIFQGSNET